MFSIPRANEIKEIALKYPKENKFKTLSKHISLARMTKAIPRPNNTNQINQTKDQDNSWKPSNIIKEDYFKKKGGKGSTNQLQVSRIYLILTNRAVEMFEDKSPKGTLALDDIYVTFNTNSNTLIIGKIGHQKEYKFNYEGTDQSKALEWYDSIRQAQDDLKKKYNTIDETNEKKNEIKSEKINETNDRVNDKNSSSSNQSLDSQNSQSLNQDNLQNQQSSNIQNPNYMNQHSQYPNQNNPNNPNQNNPNHPNPQFQNQPNFQVNQFNPQYPNQQYPQYYNQPNPQFSNRPNYQYPNQPNPQFNPQYPNQQYPQYYNQPNTINPNPQFQNQPNYNQHSPIPLPQQNYTVQPNMYPQYYPNNQIYYPPPYY